MNWSYIAGYFDGEACLLLGVAQDKRHNTWKSLVDGWNIFPNLCVTSYDKTVLAEIKEYLESRRVKVYKLETKTIRYSQTDNATRLSIFGWDNVRTVCKLLITYAISKREQYEKFLELYDIWDSRKELPGHPYHRKGWTKTEFITAMRKVDEINSKKCKIRGKYNSAYFINLWNISSGL